MLVHVVDHACAALDESVQRVRCFDIGIAQNAQGRGLALPQSAEGPGELRGRLRFVTLGRMVNVLRWRAFPEQAGCDVDIGEHSLAVSAAGTLVVTLEAKHQTPGEAKPRIGSVVRVILRVIAEKGRSVLGFPAEKQKERHIKPRAHMVGVVQLQQALRGIRRLGGAREMPETEHRSAQTAQKRSRRFVFPPLRDVTLENGRQILVHAGEDFQSLGVLPGGHFHVRQFDLRLEVCGVQLDCFLDRGAAFARGAQATRVADEPCGNFRRRHFAHAR